MARPRNLNNTDELWSLFIAYKDHVENNPRTIDKALQSGKVVQETLKVPLTIEGFKNFCYDEVGCIDRYLLNRDSAFPEFVTICSRIKDNIRQDQIEGGMVGQYNPSITQRLNNLVERQDVTSGDQSVNEVTVNIIKRGLIED